MRKIGFKIPEYRFWINRRTKINIIYFAKIIFCFPHSAYYIYMRPIFKTIALQTVN